MWWWWLWSLCDDNDHCGGDDCNHCGDDYDPCGCDDYDCGGDDCDHCGGDYHYGDDYDHCSGVDCDQCGGDDWGDDNCPIHRSRDGILPSVRRFTLMKAVGAISTDEEALGAISSDEGSRGLFLWWRL